MYIEIEELIDKYQLKMHWLYDYDDIINRILGDVK